MTRFNKVTYWDIRGFKKTYLLAIMIQAKQGPIII